MSDAGRAGAGPARLRPPVTTEQSDDKGHYGGAHRRYIPAAEQPALSRYASSTTPIVTAACRTRGEASPKRADGVAYKR